MKRFIFVVIITFQVMALSHHASSGQIKMGFITATVLAVACVGGGIYLYKYKKEKCDEVIEKGKDGGRRFVATVKKGLPKKREPT